MDLPVHWIPQWICYDIMMEYFPTLYARLDSLVSAAEKRGIPGQAHIIASTNTKRAHASKKIFVTREVGLGRDRAKTSPTDGDWGDRPLMRVLEGAGMELESAIAEMEALE